MNVVLSSPMKRPSLIAMDYKYAVSDGGTARAGATDPSLLVALQ
jgi:hypothetical protein